MKVLVDTTVWSETLRRQPGAKREEIAQALEKLIERGQVILIGPVRQELLSGVRDRKIFDSLKHKLRGFPDESLRTEDYESAADFYNRCREKGVQGSHVDLLICAMALNRKAAIFTLDRDFGHYAKVIPIQLFKW